MSAMLEGSRAAGGVASSHAAAHATTLPAALAVHEAGAVRAEFVRQGAFIALDRFLPADVTASLVADGRRLGDQANRNYLPGHKKGASVSRHTIDRLAPDIAALYRAPALLRFLEGVCGEALQPCPADDPHAYALYYYAREGDHIGWHYDTSYYDGRRYTLLLGVVDESSCSLDYELHTREQGVAVVSGSKKIPPGGLVFFDGDKLRHRITPSAAGDFRVSLTFEYVTNPAMRPWKRALSNLKDAFAYFGLRQVLGGRPKSAR
jgi:hypothetical protein